MLTRYSGPVSGSYGDAWAGYTGSRTYARTGHESLIVSNSHGDHSTPNAFAQQSTSVSGGLIDGINGSDFIFYYQMFSQLPTPIYDYWNRVDHLPVPANLGNRLIANTTPDRADTLLPAAVFELADLPSAIYHAGRKLLKGPKPPPRFPRKPGTTQAAADWVAINFGWLPLIGDLKNLVNLSGLAAKREQEFDRLYSGRGLKRRLNLHSASEARSFSYAVGAPFYTVIQTASGECLQNIWGTVRWTPTGVVGPNGSPLGRPTPNEIRRIVLGLNAANVGANLWEAIPWSWFIDYFFNVQDYLVATGGMRSAIPTKACVMVHHRTTLTSPSLVLLDAFKRETTLSKGVLVNESKDRMPVSPGFVEAGFPTLSAKQLSILGALAVLKAPRL